MYNRKISLAWISADNDYLMQIFHVCDNVVYWFLVTCFKLHWAASHAVIPSYHWCNVFLMSASLLSICDTAVESVPGIPDELHLTRIYAAIQNLPHPIPHLNFYQALSCFRMASIIQVHLCTSAVCTSRCSLCCSVKTNLPVPEWRTLVEVYAVCISGSFSVSNSNSHGRLHFYVCMGISVVVLFVSHTGSCYSWSAR